MFRLFFYSDKEITKSILKEQKLFTFSYTRCVVIGDGDDNNIQDIASRTPCLKCHKRIKNILDADPSWGDGDAHCIAPNV